MEELKKRYFDFVDELDPYRDTSEDPETLEEMLYNLICIKEDWTEMEPDLQEVLNATIKQFKAAGVEII
jgi:cytochrome oxidase Cu insertion factor (SCO1/SenC/PrrC family)